MSHATLTSLEGDQSNNPTLTIAIDREDLETVMTGAATFDEPIAAGLAVLSFGYVVVWLCCRAIAAPIRNSSHS